MIIMAIGWQQREILKRLLEYPGLSTSQLCKDLSLQNRPHKKLETQGLIENQPITKNGKIVKNQWYLTQKGVEEIAKRKLASKERWAPK